jgi:hypothetical protein
MGVMVPSGKKLVDGHRVADTAAPASAAAAAAFAAAAAAFAAVTASPGDIVLVYIILSWLGLAHVAPDANSTKANLQN